MATLTINSPSVSTQFGTFSATILMEASSSSTTTMNLLSMPSIKQDFDVQDTAKDLSTFRYNLSTITLAMFDDLADGTKMFTAINNLGTNDVIRIKITTNIFDNTNRTDFFVATRADCKYDRVKRTITIDARAALRYDVEVTSFSTTGLLTTGSGGESADAGLITSKDAILAFLKSQGDSSIVTKIIGHKFTHTLSDLGDLTIGFKTIGLDANTYYNTYAKAQTHVLKFGIIEGAFLGAMLGFSFYVRRNFNSTSDSDHYADISASDLREFGIKFDIRNIKQFDTNFQIQDNGVSGAPDIGTSVTETVNSRGSQDIDLTVGIDDMNTLFNDPNDATPYKTVLLSSGSLSDSAISTSTFTDSSTGISTNARASYKKSLGIGTNNLDNDNRFLIDFEILGVDKLRPYQFINFASDIHPSVNGKKARPSYLEYDLENNIIKGEAYLI